MIGIVPQGIYSAQFDVILQLAATHGYSLIYNSIDFGSKIINKVITAVLLRNVNTS